MYIQKHSKKVKDKVYQSTLLVESYRENGKVKHRTLANLSKLPEELVEQMKSLLKGGIVKTFEDFEIEQGKSVGALIVFSEIASRIGIPKILGDSKKGTLSLILIIGRLLTGSSRRYLAREWVKDQALEEIFGVSKFDEEDLYQTLDWLSLRQEEIEDKLFKKRYKGGLEELYLYDVTSSYFEGNCNELADFGYNRDKKAGKKQIVIGLLTDKDGIPVSVEVFEGNTSDSKTVSNQLKKLKERFQIKHLILVGDRGMLKSTQVEEIEKQDKEEDFNWKFISAISKSEIESFLNKGVLQLGLFDEEITEIEIEKKRYILRKNPIIAEKTKKGRASKIEVVEKLCEEKANYLKEHTRAKLEVAQKKIELKIEKLKLKKYVELEVCEKNFSLKRKEINWDLDGCYALKTNVPSKVADSATIHQRYKDLSQVEFAFRTIKTGFEEIRPIFVRKESRTRGHVFVCMLAYLLIFELWESTKELGFTRNFVVETLEKIHYNNIKIGGKTIKQLPKTLQPHQQQILDILKIMLPTQL